MKVLPSGSTSQSEYFNLLDKTAGTAKTGVTISQLLIGHTRTRSPNSTTTLSALPNVSAAYSSGGAIEVDSTNAPGLYRVDVPNAAYSTQSGVTGVILTLYAATTTLSVAPAMKEVQLDAVISSVTGNVAGSVGSVVGNIGGSVQSVTGNVGGSVGSVVGGVGGTVALVASVTGNVGGAVGSVTGNVGGSVASVVGNVGGSVGSVVGNIGGSVSSVANAVVASSVTGNVGGSVGSVVGNVGGSVNSVATSVLASSVTGNVGGSVGSVVGGVGGAVAGSVGSVVGNVGGSVGSVVGNVGGSVASVIASVLANSVSGNVGGSVGSVNNTVTASVSTNNDKSGYSLTADFRIKKNTALAAFPFVMISNSDHITPQTSLTVSSVRSLDGTTFASCANAVSEVGNGVYKIDLAAGDLNADTVTLLFSATGADNRIISFVTQTE